MPPEQPPAPRQPQGDHASRERRRRRRGGRRARGGAEETRPQRPLRDDPPQARPEERQPTSSRPPRPSTARDAKGKASDVSHGRDRRSAAARDAQRQRPTRQLRSSAATGPRATTASPKQPRPRPRDRSPALFPLDGGLRAVDADRDAPVGKRSGCSLLECLSTPRDEDGEDVFVDSEETSGPEGSLVNVVTVRLDTPCRREAFDAGEHHVDRGDKVVVETERGLAIGTVICPPQRRMMHDISLRRMLRRVDRNDDRQRARNQAHEAEAFSLCRARIRDYKLPMKLIRVEYLHSGNKAVVYFSAEGRVDFRQLARDLARELRTRIEIRQVGVRDSAKMAGGVGPCGRELCCSSWLQDFAPVSIRMAKDQNLVLNPTKVSGVCGRLKCCLAYEEHLYREARKVLPRVGRTVTTPLGEGRVIELDIPRLLVRVSHPSGVIETFPANVVQANVVHAPSGAAARHDRDDAPDG